MADEPKAPAVTRDSVNQDIANNPESGLDIAGIQKRISDLTSLNGTNYNYSVADPAGLTQILYSHIAAELTRNGLPVSQPEVQKAAELSANSLISVGSVPASTLSQVLGNGPLHGSQDFFNGLASGIQQNFNPQNFQKTQSQTLNYSDDITRLTGLLQTQQQQLADQQQVDQINKLGASQRGQSDQLFQQALAALTVKPGEFGPGYSQEGLNNITNQLAVQGGRALSDVQSGAQQRGITGSSIEQFGLAQTQGQLAQAIANSTLQYLQQSGTAAEQNKQFLSNSLFQAAQSYLGAGQQSSGLAASSGAANTQNDLARSQLAAQIQQFGQSQAENVRQFNLNLQYQQNQANENLALLMNQMGRGTNGLGAALGGAVSGASAGATLGPLGALGGGIAGAGLGYFGSQQK